MKKIYLILLILPFCFSANAQKFIKIEDKTFNWGGKVGVNAALPIVKSLTIDNQEMEDIRLQYKVGYQAAVFARVNIDRFYIQPSLAWQYTEGDIRFNIPQTENSLPDGTNTQMPIGKNRITYKSATLEVPVMIGYYLVKEGPYALSMMFGPNIKYNYKTRYSTDMTDRPREFEDDNTPFGISIAAGLGVSIWRLFMPSRKVFVTRLGKRFTNMLLRCHMVLEKKYSIMETGSENRELPSAVAMTDYALSYSSSKRRTKSPR